jgi:hypothetical protein
MANPAFKKGDKVWYRALDDYCLIALANDYGKGFYYDLNDLNDRPYPFGAWEWELSNG